MNPLAGKPAPSSSLVNIPRLITAYYSERPDPKIAAQKVTFGTSGHRGSSFEVSFNEAHVLAISQAICEYRKGQGIDGPLFLGFDTHALSAPAFANALEVIAANGVEVMIAAADEYTPTPAISHAILNYNRGRKTRLADGIVITPSHNPPDSGGFKYNPPNGGPADTDITNGIETRANELLRENLRGVKRVTLESARRAASTHSHDYVHNYVHELDSILDMALIRESGIRIGVDPLGGAGVHYWPRIAERFGINLTVVNDEVDPTFRFMTLDWDGKIRMDPSSPYAMERLIGLKDRFDIAFACDTDHDRHGIVTASSGLMPPNHYLAAAINYLFSQRSGWRPDAAVGKTVVSSAMIDRVSNRLKRAVYEVPVGFKWFVAGLVDGKLGFGGEESAGASFSRIDGTVWTTDKDGLVPALLSAEMTARTGQDPGAQYRALTQELGTSFADRIDAPATPEQKKKLGKLDRQQVRISELAGEPIEQVLTQAPGNNAPIGGVKVTSRGGWFAARPSGTENIYKIYAESFHDEAHLHRLINEAQTIVDTALAGASGSRSLADSDNLAVTATAKRLLPWLVAVGFFMESLDTTILNTAVPAIASALKVAPLSMKAVLASYTLSLAVFIPISGWMANRFGTRRVFGSAIGIFTLGSFLCGLSNNIHLLVACRILQGCGGAMMLPVGRITMVRTFAKSELINAMSFVAIPGLVGPMLGPVIGGAIIGYFHWSVIFFVNIPIGLFGLYMVYRHLPNYKEQRNYPLDIVGLVLFGSGIALLSYVLEVFGETTLSGREMMGLLAISVALLSTYGLHTKRTAHPLLRLKLLAVRTFRIAIDGNLFTRLGIGGIPFLLPLLYQIGLGFSPIQSGLLIMPQAFAAMSLKLTMPLILRAFGYRTVLIANTLMLGVMIILFATIDVWTPVWLIILMAFTYGFLTSLQYTSMNSLAYADIGDHEASAAATIASTVQQLAVSFAIASASLATAIFIPDHLHATAPQMIHGIHLAMLALATLTILSTSVFARLHARDGAAVSRHQTRIPAE